MGGVTPMKPTKINCWRILQLLLLTSPSPGEASRSSIDERSIDCRRLLFSGPFGDARPMSTASCTPCKVIYGASPLTVESTRLISCCIRSSDLDAGAADVDVASLVLKSAAAGCQSPLTRVEPLSPVNRRNRSWPD